MAGPNDQNPSGQSPYTETGSAVDPNSAPRKEAWAKGQQAFETGYGALGNQITEAGKTGDIWAGLQKANEAQTSQGMENLRRQAAQGLYQSRGSLGGGGGLAAIQGANAANAYQLGNFNTQANAQRAQTAQQAQAANLAAQGTIASAAGNQYKMLQEQQNRQIRLNAALDAARSIMKRYAGSVYTTDADRQKAADSIRQEVLATETDPMVIAQVNKFIQNLGQYDNPGSIDS